MSNNQSQQAIIIKKYSNRRLYNTSTSNYITLEDLFCMIKDNIDFVVKDVKTGEDITKNILTQIIFEQEAKGYSMLPESFLRQIISFYGNDVAKIVPQYLEQTLNNFVDNLMRFQNVKSITQGSDSFKIIEELTKQNLQAYEHIIKLFFDLGGNHGK